MTFPHFVYCEDFSLSVYLDPDSPLEWCAVFCQWFLTQSGTSTTRGHLDMGVWEEVVIVEKAEGLHNCFHG